jgi:hypothetical protein
MPRRLLAYKTPTQISGLITWLKADALALSDGTAVSSWTDSSGNSNTPAQATGALQPTFKASILNGLPIIRFNGSNRMAFPSESPFDVATPTIFVVAFWTSGNGDIISKNTTAFGDARRRKMQIGVNSGGFSYASGSDGASISISTTTSQWNMFGSVTNSDSAHSLYLNGVETDYGTALSDSTFNSTTVELGDAFTNGAESFTGDVAEIIVYNVALNGLNVVGLQNYLAGKYNLNVDQSLGGGLRTAISGRTAVSGRVNAGSSIAT